MKYSSSGLIKSLMIMSIAGFVILSLVLIAIFTNAFYDNLDAALSRIEINYNKNAKVEAEDKIDKISDFIKIYKKTLEDNTKLEVKDNVNFAINIVNNVYRQFSDFPEGVILQKISDRLRDIRFFSDKSGYFFIYDLNGNCILLPTTPSIEGSNQIDFLDGKGEHTIKKAIKIVKTKGEGFASWYWHKIDEKEMLKKIGFIKLFKPLGIFIGTGRYQKDIDKIIKNETAAYLKGLDKDKYGYIFAYDFSGNSMLDEDKYTNINRWSDATSQNHLVRYATRGAQVNPDGFFLQYSLKNQKNKFSYIRLVPEFDWVIGTNVKSAKDIYENQKRYLQVSLKKTLQDSIYIALIILVIFVLGFLLISLKIKQVYKGLEDTVRSKTKELIERKNVFKKLFDTAFDGIVLSKYKKVFDCNDAALKIFEAENKEDFLKVDIRDYFPAKQDDGRSSVKFLEEKLDIESRIGSVEFEIIAKTLKGNKIWLNVVYTQITFQNELAGYFVLRDVTQKKKIEKDFKIQQKKLMFQAKHDSLTSLPNRTLLMDRLSQDIKKVNRNKRYLAVAFLDIDNFKIVNDAFGHDIGDLLLIEIASVLKGYVRTTDIVSRVSGDEFVLVLDDLTNRDDSSVVIQKIVDRFQDPFYIKNTPFNITFSIGISIYPNDASDEQNLLRYADMAMYRAKNSGKNRYVYYDESMNSDVLKHIKIEQEIREGIENDEFILCYQPQFEVGSEKIVGFEALVRWEHPELGLKYPDYFIQIAENSSLMIPLGELISKKAMKQVSRWYDMGLEPGTMSVNFTSKQLESGNFFDKLEKLFEETKCKPEWVEAELVERYVMRDTKKTTDLLESFKDINMQVAIDDFGTGYSSLGYLKYLEISKLKIDKAFIDELESDKKDRAIAKSIIDLSIGLDLKVLAEGVETKKQYEILRDLGCQIIQGYYFSKPISADEAERLLIEKAEEKEQPLR